MNPNNDLPESQDTQDTQGEGRPIESVTPAKEPTAAEQTTPLPPVAEESVSAETEAGDVTDAESETDAEPPAAEPTEPVEPPVRYRWTYAEQRLHDEAVVGAEQAGRKKRKGRGGFAYAMIMTAMFALSFCILLAVLLIGKGIQTATGTVQNDPVTRADMLDVENAKRSVVVVEVVTKTGSGVGTGVILNESGYIATNHHVVDGATAIRVTFLDGIHAEATLIGSSEMDDLAVIQVSAAEVGAQLVPATFVEDIEENCYVGQTVYAIGTPGGAEFAFTTTRGIISYVNRTVKQYNSDGTLSKKLRTIQTDAMVNPGNSGGPLVDTEGRVVGIVSMKLGDGYDGIGFAIPSDGALEILNAIMRDGNADSINSSLSSKRPLLGIVGVYVEADHTYVMDDSQGRIFDCQGTTVEAVRASILQAGGTPGETISPADSGIYVTDVTEGMGAFGKLQRGDIILSAESMRVTSMSGLMDVVNDMDIGDIVTLKIRRGGETLTVEVELMAQKN